MYQPNDDTGSRLTSTVHQGHKPACARTRSCLFGVAPPLLRTGHHEPLIYLVDDDEGFRDSLRWLLESAGYKTVAYACAERFLEEYESGTAACLILDVGLPGMSGLDLQQELKRRGHTLPIVFASADGGIPAAVEAIKNGASHFLAKPFAESQLLTAIERAIAQHQTLDVS